jgi:hypothetical protein
VAALCCGAPFAMAALASAAAIGLVRPKIHCLRALDRSPARGRSLPSPRVLKGNQQSRHHKHNQKAHAVLALLQNFAELDVECPQVGTDPFRHSEQSGGARRCEFVRA